MVMQKKKRTRRTPAEMEAFRKTESKGLGDTVEKVFKATGIAKLVHFIAGEDCGCEERKNKLNEWFPYDKINCMNEEQYNWAHKYFTQGGNQISVKLQKEFLLVYNHVFTTNHEPTNCGDCFRIWHKQLFKIYKTYENTN